MPPRFIHPMRNRSEKSMIMAISAPANAHLSTGSEPAIRTDAIISCSRVMDLQVIDVGVLVWPQCYVSLLSLHGWAWIGLRDAILA